MEISLQSSSREEGKPGGLQAGQPHLSLWGGAGENPLAKHFQQMKDKQVIESSQHGFVKEKLCLTNQSALCNEVNSLVGEGRTVDVFRLSLSKSSDTNSHNNFIVKLTKYGLGKCHMTHICHMKKG